MEKPATLGRAGPPADTDHRADDATLIARSRAEPEAFAAIFDRHATEIHRYAARRLGPGPAEDVVGETFLVAFRRRDGYDPSHRNAGPWLFGIATNMISRHRQAEIRLYRALARVGVDAVVESPADEVVARVAATSQRRAIAAALARLKTAMTDLPDPGAVRELKDLRADVAGRAPEELHQARGLLLTEIQAERGTGKSSHPAFPSRWLRPVLLGATAAAAVAALTVSLLPGPAAHRPRPGAGSAPAAASGSASSQPSTPAVLTAAYVLNRAASTAASSSRPVPRPGQFIYVSSMTMYVSTEVGRSGDQSWLYRTRRQIWQSVDGRRAGLLQIVDRGNVKLPWGPVPPAHSDLPAGWTPLPPASCPGATPARGTYAFLASLPTDPGRLRTWIYRHPGGGNTADAQAWSDIGDMLREMLVPPKVAAALFRVAATIPGATVVPRAANAAGRVGVGVSRSGAELIFDPKTYQLTGEGGVLTKPVPGQGPAGTVVASTAQLREAVVNHLPDVTPSPMDKAVGGVTC